MKGILKSIWAVVAGFLTVAVLSVATDFVLESLHIFPSQSNPAASTSWVLVVALLYRSVYAFLGGYLTARLASRNPMAHVLVLMVLGLIGGVSGAIAGWSLGHHWYPVMLAATSPFFVLIGGIKATKSTP